MSESVSPSLGSFNGKDLMANDRESDADEEPEVGEPKGEEAEKMGLPKEDEFLRKLRDPKLPTAEEVERHVVCGHLPYRDWCHICVKSKGQEMGHYQEDHEGKLVPEYAWDYCFPGNEMGFHWTVLAGKEREGKSFMASAVPMKGGTGRFAVDKCVEFIDENGDAENKILVKTDQENSTIYLARELVRERGGEKTIVEESPVKSSASNGVVERGVKEIEGQIRVLYLGLQERLGRRLDCRERILAFMPEYAAYLLNRLMVGHDGKVAYERNKGKKPTVLGLEFGEKVLYKIKLGNKLEKINARWEHGIFVGVRRKSGEVWIAKPDGIVKARSVKRIPFEERWGEDCVNWVKWVPWHRYRGDEFQDGEVPEGVPESERASPVDEKPKVNVGGKGGVVFVETREKVPRKFYISYQDIQEHGGTPRCKGCYNMARGMSNPGHTEECRSRFEELLKNKEKVKNAKRRREEFEEKEMQRRSKLEEEEKKRKEDKKEEEGKSQGKKRGHEDEDGGVSKDRKKKVEFKEGGKRKDREEEMGDEGRAKMKRDGVSGDSGHPLPGVDVRRSSGSNGESGQGGVDVDAEVGEIVMVDIEEWVNEVIAEMVDEEETWDAEGEAWDDVKGGGLPVANVVEARKEEIKFMEDRGIWTVKPVEECWKKTGKAPVSVRWVDTNKGGEGEIVVRSRLVARDFKGGDKDRDDLFAETPPLEAKRLLFSRAVSRRRDGKLRKLLFIDVRKAHLNPECKEDVYIELPEECGVGKGMCGKLNFWLYGFRPAAQAWEKLYSEKLGEVGFVRGITCGVVFYHPERDVSLAVHGDDFTFCGLERDLKWIRDLMGKWFDIKIRGMLGPEERDDKEIVILGRTVRYVKEGIEYEADKRHREMILEAFGLSEGSKGSSVNGDKSKREEIWEEEELVGKEISEFRGLAARLNFLSQDCPDLQFGIKESSREMACPKKGSWNRMKKVARYLVDREAVIWKFGWQEEGKFSYVMSDSDWGGNSRDRKSTSGGVWMLGGHCIKTWSATQGAYALSSAEAELYAMIEGVTRAKGLRNLAWEMGFKELSNVIKLGTDSSAAKSFVNRRGLGKMRHLEIRDLWLQKEVADGKLEVGKIWGTENPADLMTKILTKGEIRSRLERMGLIVKGKWDR